MYGYRKKKQMYDYDQCEEMIKKETERQAVIFLNKIKETADEYEKRKEIHIQRV